MRREETVDGITEPIGIVGIDVECESDYAIPSDGEPVSISFYRYDGRDGHRNLDDW